MQPIPDVEQALIEIARTPRRRGRRWAQAGVAAGLLVLAACNRVEPVPGDSPQVTAAKAAVAGRLSTPDSAEYRYVLEYSDGVVCGEVNAKKMYSGTDVGFRKFIYNVPEPGHLVMQTPELSREEVAYWCSEQPDKRLRMLAASAAELKQACEAGGRKASDMSCRLAATQKQAFEELQAATTAAKASQPAASAAPAPAVASASAAPPIPAAPPAAAAPAAVPSTAVAAATPAPAAPAASAAPSGNAEAAIVAEVGAALQAWRERWQDGDVDGYLRMYAPSFTGDAGSRADWEQQRRQKMKNARPSIRVEQLEALRVTPQEVELRFVQVYAARQHRDRGLKTLVFRRAPEGWLIADERWAPAS